MSLGAWWLTLKTNQKLVLNILVGVLLFAAGWQLGRVMSPYYAAHPIIFEEGSTDAGGSQEELVKLRKEGVSETTERGVTPVSGNVVTSPGVEERSTGESASGEIAGTATRGRFVGSKNSNKYHAVPECTTWKQIKTANQIWFADQAEAQSAGYMPTSCTAKLLGD